MVAKWKQSLFAYISERRHRKINQQGIKVERYREGENRGGGTRVEQRHRGMHFDFGTY